MARDYAKKERSRSAPARKKGGGKSKGPVAGWLWGAAGLVVGLFIAFLVFLDQSGRTERAEPEKRDQQPAATTPIPDEKKAAKAGAEKTEPAKKQPPSSEAKAEPEKKPLSYDFYKVLPEFEVKVPAERKAAPVTAPPPRPAPGVHYLLQVGSFRRAQDADARKAELALLGLVSSVHTVTDGAKGSWHRVRLGPYREMEQINRLRERLRENGIESLVIKESS